MAAHTHVASLNMATTDAGAFICSVRWATGQTDILSIAPTMAVHEIKEQLSNKHKKPAQEIVLHYAGKALECSKMIRDYDVVNESVLRAMTRPGPQTEWHGTNALYALSSDGLRVEAKMYDGMICKCTPRPPPGPELTLPGVGPWTFHWEVQQGEYCPDQESFQQRNIELLEWKGDVVARTPVVDTKFVIHRADMKAAIPGAAHVTLTPSVPLTSYYLMRINGGAIRDGIKIIGQAGLFPAPLTALFRVPGAPPLPVTPVSPTPANANANGNGNAAVDVDAVDAVHHTPDVPAILISAAAVAASATSRSDSHHGAVAQSSVRAVSSSSSSQSSSSAARRVICDGRAVGYYREELLSNPGLIRESGLCVYCGHVAAEHTRRPIS